MCWTADLLKYEAEVQAARTDFPDQIVKARTYLGAPPDAMDVPLFLEVSFRGRKESDENLENWNTDKGGEIIKNVAGPFVYNLILKNFDMEITQAGSTYNFETVVRDNLFTADSFFRTKRFMTISGRTIGQMLKSLEDQTNDYNVEQGIPDRISFAGATIIIFSAIIVAIKEPRISPNVVRQAR